MDVAEEVHVGGSAVEILVLHKELTEQHLRLVLLPHDLELGGGTMQIQCEVKAC